MSDADINGVDGWYGKAPEIAGGDSELNIVKMIKLTQGERQNTVHRS